MGSRPSASPATRILKSLCGYDPARLTAIAGRFSAPVFPGETIRTEMWRDGTVVSFRARVVERDVVAINNGRAEIVAMMPSRHDGTDGWQQPTTTSRRSAPRCARCAPDFPGEYWRKLDRERGYPTEFVAALTEAGFLAALIPEQYGGSGLTLLEAAAIMEEIHASGCNGAACHAQMYTMGTLLRHGSDAQKQRWLPAIASGELRLQAFGVTEPTSGTDTLALRTTAVRDGDHYVINGQKIWTSRAEHSDLHAAARAHHAARAGEDAHRRALGLSGRHAARPGRQHPDQPDPHHDEPRHHGDLLRRPARAGGESDRRGRARASATSSPA